LSRGTVKTGSRSRKSRHEIDYDNMSVLEIEGLIMSTQEQIKNLNKAKKEANKNTRLAS